jgi:hypothetical protein
MNCCPNLTDRLNRFAFRVTAQKVFVISEARNKLFLGLVRAVDIIVWKIDEGLGIFCIETILTFFRGLAAGISNSVDNSIPIVCFFLIGRWYWNPEFALETFPLPPELYQFPWLFICCMDFTPRIRAGCLPSSSHADLNLQYLV